MPAWYDIRALSGRSKETCEGLEDSTKFIQSLVKKEVENGIPESRIVLSGFSQGAALSLWVGLQYEKKLGGILVMSGYLPRPQAFKPTPAALDTPVLFCHGTSDDVVLYDWAKQSEKAVRDQGVHNVEFKVYERMGHSVSPGELKDALKFLSTVVPNI